MSDDTIESLRAQLATVRAAAKQLEASFATRDAYERRVLGSVAGVERASLLRELDAAREESRTWNAAATQAETERDDARRMLGELLARIHRDGGHRIVAVGWEAAAREADAIVVGMLGAARERDSVRAVLRSGLRCDEGLAWATQRHVDGDVCCDAHAAGDGWADIPHANAVRACGMNPTPPVDV